MNHVDNPTHFIAFGIIILISFIMAFLFAGIVLFETVNEEGEIPEFEAGEIDLNPYPEEDEVIFPKY